MGRPLSKRPRHPHAAFIDDLGGPKRVAKMIQHRTGASFGVTAVNMWTVRGVAAKYRPVLAEIARTRGIPVPPGFILGG